MNLASTEWLGLPVEVQRGGRPPCKRIRSVVPFLGDWRAWVIVVCACTPEALPGSAEIGAKLTAFQVWRRDQGGRAAVPPGKGTSLQAEPPRRGVLRLETASPSRPNV